MTDPLRDHVFSDCPRKGEAMKRVGAAKRGGIGAAWAVADGPASMLYQYGRITVAARNHAAVEGAEFP